MFNDNRVVDSLFTLVYGVRIMNQSKWFLHPIAVFIFSVIALGMSLFLYIYWYVEVSSGLHTLVEKFNIRPEQVLESQTWVVIVVLSILVGIILMGIFTIFVYHQKTSQLYRLQNNFINNFTHELKTPVTSLKLYMETFLKHDLSRQDQINYLRFMISDVNRLSNNINSILNLAKIDSGSFGEEWVTLDIVAVVEQFCRDNWHLFKDCRIQVHNDTGGPLYYRIDRAMFEMLLMNLLTNAIKYNRSETPLVDIYFQLKPPKLHILFVDNGIGVEKKELENIFNKFYQVGKSDNMSAIGSGLGLYIAQHIARRMKGKMVAESQGVGEGTTFRLILPYRVKTKREQYGDR